MPVKHLKNVLKKALPLLKRYKKLLAAIYVLFLIISAYHIYYGKRVVPGVAVGAVRVGGMTFNQAKDALQIHEKAQDISIVFNHENKQYIIKPEDIGFSYDWDSSLNRAFEVGRTGSILRDTKDKIAGLFKVLYIAAFYDYEEEMLGNKFSAFRGEVNIERHDAGFALENNKVVITPSSPGLKIDDDQMFRLVIEQYDSIVFAPKDLPVDTAAPEVLETNIRPLIPQVEKVISNKLVIKKDKKEWLLSRPQLLELIRPKKDSEGNFILVINKSKYEMLMETLGFDINALPKGKVTSVDESGKVTGFEMVSQGTEIDSKVFTENFKDALFGLKPSVELVLKEMSGPHNKERYGILALLGEGSSTFTGSISSRVHNIFLAASRTDGVLVPPGATYSLNKTIGEVTAKTGYDAAYIILGGRTVLGEGGGVCQTSTTMFRAVLNSGLPVVKRYPHAYRVRYYEQDMPVGFDAAVFQPSLDFQFKNDTPNYVMIQTEPDPKNYKLTFKIFGTPDGRTVEISEPVVTSQIAPGAPVYQDEPTMKKGDVRQVEWPAWGASVSFSRTVKKEGTVSEDFFKSRYQPWRAVFLVGTKE